MSDILVAGLGNPGEQYRLSRHNAGRLLFTEAPDLCHLDDFSWRRDLTAQLSYGRCADTSFTVILPETYMNLSGQSVAKAMKKEKSANLIVVHDDLALTLGQFKISLNRGAGGHNGVQSIIDALGHKNFIRFRLGINRPAKAGLLSRTFRQLIGTGRGRDFVLASFRPEEKEQLLALRPIVWQAVSLIGAEGIQAAMNKFNRN
ncbi:MAG: aminoacyl-tRNA hydrolase [Candidatus Paceibacterota bacterium]